jgi:glycosyltransferase involved in cell wall biosynthesis
MTLPSRSVCLYVDGAQNPFQLERGIGRYVSEHACAIDALAPSLLHSVSLNPGRSLTGNLSPFLGKEILSLSSGYRMTEGPSGRVPLVYHIMSPFEANSPIDVMWPRWARDSRIATVVTLYDLIPLVFPDQYLGELALRAFYGGRLDLVRHADGVLAISEHTASDAVERLQVSPERVHVIRAGTSEHFAGMFPSDAAAWDHLSRHLKSVRPGFLLYVGGADFRKNMEGLIAGFGRLPAGLRAQHQLVIANILMGGQAESLRTQAELAGLGPEELVLPGHVSDFDLGALYRACALFVFPSFYEGFGLPMLEAMSCGAPVAASVTTTGPEVLGDLEGTFEPHDPESIAACLGGILGSPEVLDRLRARSRRRVGEFTWRRVAERSVEAYERVVAGTARRRSRRARIALVTPWPPERSWVADYNVRLAGELGRRVDVDVVVGGAADLYAEPSGRGVRLMEVREFEELGHVAQHDRVLYCMGNSRLHGHVYALLRRRPGVVVVHDVRLTGFYRWYAGVERPEDPEGALDERIDAMYRDRLPVEALQGLGSAVDRQAALGVYMTRELQSYAEQCLVHSRFAREVLELDRGLLDRQVQVSVLPFGLLDGLGVSRQAARSRPLIVSLGSTAEVGGVATVIDAFALLATEMPAARLVIAGYPGDPAASERWHGDGVEHASQANIELAGEISAERYVDLLQTADLAVELQLMSGGEASMVVADCLAGGAPTIVTDLGWAGELPPEVAEKVPPGVAPGQLKDRMVGLLADNGKRAAISRSALEHARAASFSKVADAYLNAIELN